MDYNKFIERMKKLTDSQEKKSKNQEDTQNDKMDNIGNTSQYPDTIDK